MEEWEHGLEGVHQSRKRKCPACSSFNVIIDSRLGRIHCVECSYEGRS
ncbi:MAG TPA: hypothetical protein VJB08_04780 [Candidatus Nanoarchaeia archaeon]|nr:hypothetical protein [Candidatus Nanoarchaeia archaeon]